MLFAVNKLRKERAISSKCVETLFWKNSASPTHTHSPTISTENRLPIMTLRFLGKDKWVLDIHSPSSFGRNRGILERWWEYLGSWVVGRGPPDVKTSFFGGMSQVGNGGESMQMMESAAELDRICWWPSSPSALINELVWNFFFFLVENIIVYLFCRVAFSLDKLGLRAVVSDCKYRKKNNTKGYNG